MEMNDFTPFAQWLRRTRKLKNLTLAEVGARAGHEGAYISIHEHAKSRRPRIETADKLAKALAYNAEEEALFVREARRACGYSAYGPASEVEDDFDGVTNAEDLSFDLGVRHEEPLLRRITVDPHKFGGKPIIRDHRLAVEHVLGMLAAGDSHETILEGYDWMEPEDIRACLIYARRMVANERIELLRVEHAA